MTVTIINPSAKLLTPASWIERWAEICELAGRTCYRSEPAGDPERFCVRRLIEPGHESQLEHVHLSAKLVLSRAAAFQLIRHRHTEFDGDVALGQESQRFVRYDAGLEIVEQPDDSDSDSEEALATATICWESYCRLRRAGRPAEKARLRLPGDTATRLVVTASLRQWRHFWRLRCDSHAQAEIRMLATQIRDAVAAVAPWAVEGL